MTQVTYQSCWPPVLRAPGLSWCALWPACTHSRSERCTYTPGGTGWPGFCALSAGTGVEALWKGQTIVLFKYNFSAWLYQRLLKGFTDPQSYSWSKAATNKQKKGSSCDPVAERKWGGWAATMKTKLWNKVEMLFSDCFNSLSPFRYFLSLLKNF